MKYWKQVFWALRKPILGLIPFTVLLGFLIWLPNRDTAPLWKPMCCTVGAGLLLIILLVVMISATLKKEEPLNEIMAKEGYSEAWLQKHSEIYPTPDRTQKLRRVTQKRCWSPFRPQASMTTRNMNTRMRGSICC